MAKKGGPGALLEIQRKTLRIGITVYRIVGRERVREYLALFNEWENIIYLPFAKGGGEGFQVAFHGIVFTKRTT